MKFSRKQMWVAAATMCWTGAVQARDCPCLKGHANPVRSVSYAADEDIPPAPVPEASGAALGNASSLPPPVPPAPAPSPPAVNPPPPVPAAGGHYQGAAPLPQVASPLPVLSGYQPQAGMNRWGMMPPPGTLGRTYQRRSALIPDEDHPRVGIVAVKLPEDANVSARGMKVKWTGEEWLLESSQPLVPGIPHVYAVKAEWETPTGKVQQTRWVRLIMGRVVDLEF